MTLKKEDLSPGPPGAALAPNSSGMPTPLQGPSPRSVQSPREMVLISQLRLTEFHGTMSWDCILIVS